MQAAWLLRLLSGSQMALQKKGAALREVVGKPPWELCHQAPSPTTWLHPAARQVGRSVATCARSLNVQRACVCVCVCGISGCGRGCIVGLPRRPCGAGIDIPQLACPPVPRPAGSQRHPRVARHGSCGAGAAPSPVGFTRVDSHLPPCKVLLTAGEDSEKRGQGGFGLRLLCSRK